MLHAGPCLPTAKTSMKRHSLLSVEPTRKKDVRLCDTFQSEWLPFMIEGIGACYWASASEFEFPAPVSSSMILLNTARRTRPCDQRRTEPCYLWVPAMPARQACLHPLTCVCGPAECKKVSACTAITKTKDLGVNTSQD